MLGAAKRAARLMASPVSPTAREGVSISARGIYALLGLAAQGLVRFLTSAVIGRLGGPSTLGEVASALSTAIVLSLLWPTSSGTAASRFIARARGAEDLSQAGAVARLLERRTAQAAALLALAGGVAWVVVRGGSVLDGLYIAMLVVGYSGYALARGTQYGTGQVARATLWDLCTGLMALLGVVALALAGARGLVLLLPISSANVIYTAASRMRAPGAGVDRKLRQELDAFVAVGVVGTVSSAGFLQLSMILARSVSTAAEAGQYAAAMALATPTSIIAGSLSMVLFPSMAQALGRGDEIGFRQRTDLATRALVTVIVGVIGALVISSGWIVSLIWGARFGGASSLLPILLVAVLFNAISTAAVNALTSRSQRGMVVSAASSLSGLAVGVVIWMVVGPRYGTTGIAIGYLMGVLVISLVPVVIIWRRDHHSWGTLAVRVGLGVGLMVGALTALRAVNADSSAVAAVATCIAFGAAWSLLCRRDLRRVVVLLGVPSLLGRLRPRSRPQKP